MTRNDRDRFMQILSRLTDIASKWDYAQFQAFVAMLLLGIVALAAVTKGIAPH